MVRFFIFIVFGFGLFSFIQEEETILWKKSRQLTWDDYRGKPKRRFAAASTVYSLHRFVTEDENGNITAHVEALFYPNDSWKRSDWINESLLEHERKHFDVVELFARKYRKALITIKVSDKENAERQVDELYDKFSKEMDVFQDAYDDKTNSSMDTPVQRQWEKNIELGLDSFAAYQKTAIILKKEIPN